MTAPQAELKKEAAPISLLAFRGRDIATFLVPSVNRVKLRTIDVLSLTPEFLEREIDLLYEQITSGCRLRLLLVSRLTHAFWVEHRPSMQEKARRSAGIVSTFMNRIGPDFEHRVEIREHSWQPSVSMILLNAYDDDAAGWVSAFTPDPEAATYEKWYFELPSSSTALLSFREQFERLWRPSDRFAPIPTLAQMEDLRQLSERMRRAASDLSDGHFHAAVVIALPEEFRYFREVFSGELKRLDEDGNYRLVVPYNQTSYSILVVFLGRMGKATAAARVERVLQTYSTDLLVSLGVAGGLKDVHIGDVLVAAQVDDYLHRGRAADSGNVPSGANGTEKMPSGVTDVETTPSDATRVDSSGTSDTAYTLIWGGLVYRPTYDLVCAALNMEFTEPEQYQAWRSGGNERLRAIFGELEAEITSEIRKLLPDDEKPQIWADDVHLASGDILAASDAFKAELARRDRNLLAVEMESVGVLTAASDRTLPVRTMVVRGISDLANKDKKKLDDGLRGKLRRLALLNAASFLKAFLTRRVETAEAQENEKV